MARRRGRNQPEQRCRICLGPRDGRWTREDAYPQWLRKVGLEVLEKDPRHRDDGWIRGPRVLLTPVCGRCQIKLNATFETPFNETLKAIVRGEHTDLSAEESEHLAMWCAKTSATIGMVRLSQNVISAPSNGVAYEALRIAILQMLDTRSLPSRTLVRGTRLRLTANTVLATPTVPLLLRDERPYYANSVVAVGHFVWEATFGIGDSWMKRIARFSEFDGRLVVLGPHSEPRSFPFGDGLTPLECEQLRADWGHERVSGLMTRGGSAHRDLAPTISWGF